MTDQEYKRFEQAEKIKRKEWNCKRHLEDLKKLKEYTTQHISDYNLNSKVKITVDKLDQLIYLDGEQFINAITAMEIILNKEVSELQKQFMAI